MFNKTCVITLNITEPPPNHQGLSFGTKSTTRGTFFWETLNPKKNTNNLSQYINSFACSCPMSNYSNQSNCKENEFPLDVICSFMMKVAIILEYIYNSVILKVLQFGDIGP